MIPEIQVPENQLPELQLPETQLPENQAPADETAAAHDPFERIIGQRRAVPFLREIRDGICLGAHPHPLLFLGRSGHGKTSLSKAFADSIGADFVRIDCGPELKSEHLVEKLTELRSFSVVFVDEFQAMRKRVQEILYGAIDSQLVPKLDRRRLDRCAPPVPITPFVLIGATNEPGRLLPAMRARMVNVVMEEYSEDDLRAIVAQKARRFMLRLSDAAVDHIVRASGGSPRNIVQIMQSIECTSASWRFGYEMGEGLGSGAHSGPGSDVSASGDDDSGDEPMSMLGDDLSPVAATSAGGWNSAGPGAAVEDQPEEPRGDLADRLAARHRPFIPDELIERALTWMGLDKAGLDATGRTILGTIGRHGRATAELIATVLGLDIGFARERLAELRARQLVVAAPGRGWTLTDLGIELVAELNLQADARHP
jgi:ABC-type dipeptide/oligopeptide/nickel transport system ATPase subunit